MNSKITIKELRTLSGMSQAQFAEFLNVPVRNIQNWETTNQKYYRECKGYIIGLIEFKLTTLGIIDKVVLEDYKKSKTES